MKPPPKVLCQEFYLDGARYVRDTVKLFAGIRDKIGYDVKLIHDVHERVAPPEAVKLARELEPFDLLFLEDPVCAEQTEVAAGNPVP